MDDSPSSLWFQPPNRRRTPPIDLVFLIILVPIFALLFLFFFLPPVLSHTSHIIKPAASVKSTWDSLNIFLVLFAILCGLMARKNDDNGFVAESSISVQSSGQWVGFSDPKVMSDHFDVDTYYNNSRRSEEVEVSDVKEIAVDTFVLSPYAPEQSLVKTAPPLPPPPPPSARSYNSKRHSFRSVGKDVKVKVPKNIKSDDLDSARSSSPPPPLLALPPPELRSHHKHRSLERKVSDATKEIATAISSLYNQKKRKNKRPPPPPPPPPLRPHPSVFQNLFKKGGKHKRIHSGPAPPPPPPPPSSIFNNIFKSKRFQSPSLPPPMTPSKYIVPVKSKQLSLPKLEPQIRRSRSKGKPPLPMKTNGYYERDDFLTSGSQSPLISMPPPPPPFKVTDMMFEVRGDFVKIRSSHSSVCSSPDHDGVEMMHGGDPIGSGAGSVSGLICFPSPDVNAKADSFISRLRDEWRMEKMG